MREELQKACDAVRVAGDVIARHFRHGTSVRCKEPHNLVSAADLESEQVVIDFLRDRFPDDHFYAEETRQDSLTSDRLWFIDPLDGTNNFAHGFPHFCCSIGFAETGVVQVGAVYDPIADELFCAERGGGARLNDEPIRVSRAAALTESLMATGFFYDRGLLLERTLQAVHVLFRNGIRGIRRTGSAALDLCYVASGRLDGFFEYHLMPWDFAAGALLVEEAGGTVGDCTGNALTCIPSGVLASNGRIQQDILSLVAPLHPER